MQQGSRRSQETASGRVWSPDVCVMLNPAAAYRFLVQQSPGGGIRLGLRRPLLVAFLLGCAISLFTTRSLTLRLVGPATIYWSFVPLAEIIALAAIGWRKPHALSLARSIDLFFTGHGLWSLWLIGLAAIWSFFLPAEAFSLTRVWLYAATALAVAWSACIDFCFFRFVLGRSRAGAGRDSLLHRAISWSLIIAIFGEPAIWPEIAARFGR